jgi:hypothetical protein
MLWLGDPQKAVIIVFQKICVKTYMLLEKNLGEKTYEIEKKRKEMGFREIGW